MVDVDNSISELTQAVSIVYKIECTYCGSDDERGLGAGSAGNAAKEFYDTGWRTTLDDTLCPDCAETEL